MPMLSLSHRSSDVALTWLCVMFHDDDDPGSWDGIKRNKKNNNIRSLSNNTLSMLSDILPCVSIVIPDIKKANQRR